jgi:hypothetical protein
MKRRCASCDTAFYDLKRVPIVCPKCGAVYDATAKLKLASVPRPPRQNPTRTKFGAANAAARKLPNEVREDAAPEREDAPDGELDADDDAVPVEDADEDAADAGDDDAEEGAEDAEER